MDIARLSATGVAVAALVIGVTAAGCSKSEEKSESSTSATSSTTSAEASSSEESTTEGDQPRPRSPATTVHFSFPPLMWATTPRLRAVSS